MEIRIIMLDGTSHSINVNPEDSVGSLKKTIQTRLGYLPVRQKLVISNGQRTPLSDDSRSLRDYGLQSGSQVSLLVTQPANIQVFLRNEKGKLSTYDITPEETVADFKTRVQHREGVPVSQQRLIHQGREMMTGTLADYSVGEHSTIDMTMRLRGG
ncbi:ubiquitin-like protein ISG15 [Amphiprion ocellaris]|uniref:Ubiquitin-like domain-containing protein n=1 Tax=Amphiprion ocellaris TaxID=80972 RepID=A0A3Q1B8Z0_AMPOC|nr:polyubiquitin-like [Amphiprion ocellaris]XP_023154768.1 ubiquitin-like protein ISG15 [Amphiprion ocellaris]